METPIELQEIEKMFNDGQVLTACRRLMKEVDNSKDLAEPALALIDKGFNKENLTSKELSLLHRGLGVIVLANPDLAEKALKRFSKGFSLAKEPGQINTDYDNIDPIAKNRPDLSENLLGLQYQVEAHYKKIGGIDSVGWNVYRRLKSLTEASPEVGTKYFKNLEQKLEAKDINAVDLCCALDGISHVVLANSSFASSALPLAEKCLKREENNGNSLYYTYGALADIYSADRTLQDRVLSLFEEGLKSPNNNEHSLDNGASDSLRLIVKECPDLADRGLDLNKGPKELLMDIQDELKKQQLTSKITNKLKELKDKTKSVNIEDIPHAKTQILREVAKDNLGKPKRSDADKKVIKAAMDKAINNARK